MSSAGEYFISLGAGENQLPLIEAARRRGLRVIGIDRDMGAKGFDLCDIRIQESIYNYRRINLKLTMGMLDGQIRGGYSASYGRALLSWAYLAERLQLNYLSRTMLEQLLDKLSVRQRLKAIDHVFFAQPKFLTIEKHLYREQLDELGYPLIFKTRSGFAKKNIYQMDRYADARAFLTRRNLQEMGIPLHELLIEQKISGDEIIVTGFVENFKFHLLTISDKIAEENPPFIDLLHVFPSKFMHDASRLADIHQKIVDVLQIPMTPLVSEWKMFEGKYYLIELSPQIPGEYIPSFMMKYGLGYDYYDNLVALTTGQQLRLPDSGRAVRALRIKYYPGKMSSVEWAEETRGAFFAKVLNEKGIRGKTRDNNQRFGVAGFLDDEKSH